MTDTIGWGDVDVDEAPRRRRVPPRLVWAVVAIVAAGAVLVPLIRAQLANSSAGWLQQEWTRAKAYDASRQSIEQSTLRRVGIGDAPRLAQVVLALDREEAGRLTQIERAVARHHDWSPDVRRAAAQVHRALASQLTDLAHDEQQAPAEVASSGYPPTVTTAATQTLIDTADAMVTASAHRHHAAKHPSTSVRLTAAAPLIDVLNRVTDVPVDATVAVLHGADIEIWNLRTGRRERTLRKPDGVSDTGQVVPIGGQSLLLGDFGGPSVLLPLDSRPAIPLPPTTVGYEPAGGSGVWLMTGASVRRYDGMGHPVGPFHRMPAGTDVAAIASTDDALALPILSPGDANAQILLWHPATGRRQTIAAGCGLGVAAGRRTIVSVACSQRSLTELDVETGHVRQLRLPRGLVADGVLTPSPDGHLVAFSVQRTDTPGGSDSLTAVGDFDTGAVTVLSDGTAALGWSADSSILLTELRNGSTVDPLAPLGYWTRGMKRMASIRIDLGGQDFAAALVD